MDVELQERLEENLIVAEEYRMRLYSHMICNVANTLHNENPDILTENTMLSLTAMARISHMPIFALEVERFEDTLTCPTVRRTFLNLRGVMTLFHKGWLGKYDIASDDVWNSWMDSM